MYISIEVSKGLFKFTHGNVKLLYDYGKPGNTLHDEDVS